MDRLIGHVPAGFEGAVAAGQRAFGRTTIRIVSRWRIGAAVRLIAGHVEAEQNPSKDDQAYAKITQKCENDFNMEVHAGDAWLWLSYSHLAYTS